MATRNPGSEPAGGDQPRSATSGPERGAERGQSGKRSGPGPGLFAALGIIALVAIVSILVYGSLREGVFLALVVLVVVAAIYPPLVIGIGLAVVAYLAIARGGLTILFNWIGGLAQTGSSPPANGAFTPLGPTLPGYTPAQTQSSYGLIKF